MSDLEELPPRADALIASMRAIGYDLSMAIADLIDNSIYAQSKNIWIDYHWEGKNSWILIADDGMGMTEDELKEAMRLGSQNPNYERDPSDLGRFGLGMKTASFSQCKLLTVHTKTSNGEISTRCWNLDHVESTKEWEIFKTAPSRSMDKLSQINEVEHGTIVLWQNLDRVLDRIDRDKDTGADEFNSKFLAVKRYLEMIFHRYLSPPVGLKISIGTAVAKPWDPYLSSNTYTRILTSEKYEDGTVTIIPYILPHISHRKEHETRIGAGPNGWNAQQGFYLYRNKRMIVPGGYLDFPLKPEEHYKLGRIMVDITNDMDSDWRIDVRKASAIPPDRIRGELLKVAKATRNEAQAIYRARTGTSKIKRKKNTADIWVKQRRGDKIIYKINKDNKVIKTILEEFELPNSWINKLFHSIESTVPHRLIIMDNFESEDCHVDLPEDLVTPPAPLINLCKEMYLDLLSQGKETRVAIDIITSLEPFNVHPVYRAVLEKFIEAGDNNG